MQTSSIPLPDEALSKPYQQNGCLTDCYIIDIPIKVSLENYIRAFYTSNVFRIERCVLSLFGYPSSDQNVNSIANGTTNKFTIWELEQRTENQLLMRERSGKTLSWFKEGANKSSCFSVWINCFYSRQVTMLNIEHIYESLNKE